LITAIITDAGILRFPYSEPMRAMAGAALATMPA
jgi:hypothetical protein